ncbi:MAG: Ig-like domain-containing protein [Anaerolineales bacterium]|nr:Ig-like domain-containing protein [Anaerolineales bacterium]MCX7754597.1 Ig-like domain-containing protein [Anaerolineales bacterium]MDW8278122.1 Ig-like domain-containing protein [Anaerolineales bacterium]
MRRMVHGLILVLLLTGLFLVGGKDALAQGGTSQYFPDTGHNVSGEFLLFYQSVPNAQFVFGSPITEQFTDPTTGRLIQYFQRARFEYFPELPVGQRVRVSPLGEYVYQRVPNEGQVNVFTPIGCRYYAETGYSICYAFLEFFDKNGGEAIFGKPKSPFVFYNGRIVQYFERARFEWYPEYPDGQRVVLAELGRIYFDLVGEDPNLLQPVKADAFPGNVTKIYARAFTWKAVTRAEDTQTVYVVVQDQTLSPVAGATVILTVNWPGGGAQSLAQTTNQYGLVILSFPVQAQPHGSLVTVQVEVLYQGWKSETVTSFRIWQ